MGDIQITTVSSKTAHSFKYLLLSNSNSVVQTLLTQSLNMANDWALKVKRKTGYSRKVGHVRVPVGEVRTSDLETCKQLDFSGKKVKDNVM